ncbi:MAG TPA: Gfo/Idh/MocA family oxidoreductase, partial [Burkholderiaceae bacterium]
ATPHAQHGEAIRACLLAGKPVLCEKPLVPHGALGRELVALARERKVFLMEALWTRFLPLYEQLGALLRDGAIGELCGVQSSFCFHPPYDPKARLFAPELAGGALLDLGVYNLSMTRWALQQTLGSCPEPRRIDVTAKLAPTGVDQRVSGLLEFDDGLSAHFICASDCVSANAMQIIGDKGTIALPRGFSHAQSALLLRPGEADQAIEAPWRINGFEGQIEAVIDCVRSGQTECAVMPLDETLATLAWMDRIRAQIGVRYPFE